MASIKTFNIRIPKELWAFIKKKSIEKEKTMNSMIIELIENFKKKCEKNLT